MADCDYNCDNNSPPPSPPPADGLPDHLKDASLSDIFLYLRSRANSGPADDYSRQGQHQQQMYMTNINMDPRKLPDGSTRTYVIVSDRPLCHKRWSNRSSRPSPAPHDNDDEGAKMLDSLEDDGFYHRFSKRGRQRSPAPLHDDDKGGTKVVCLTKMLSPSDRLEDDRFYQHFLENVTEEARKYGDLVKVVIPQPGPGIEGSGAASVVAGVGKVFLEYTHLADAAWCRRWLDGIWYGGKVIAAAFFPQDRFDVGDYDYNG